MLLLVFPALMAIGRDPPLRPVPCVRLVPFPLVNKVVCPVQPVCTPSRVYLCVARAPLEPRLLAELHLVIHVFLKMIVHRSLRMLSFEVSVGCNCFNKDNIVLSALDVQGIYVYIVYNRYCVTT